MGPQTGHLSCVCLGEIFLDDSSLLLLRRRLRGGSDVFQTHVPALLNFFPAEHGYVMMSAQGAACNYSRAGRRSTFSTRACSRGDEYLSCQPATRQLSAPHGRRTAAQNGRI